MRQKTIDIKDLSIGYKTKKEINIVAEKLNTSLYKGELTCLLGVNGIGKSTLLKTLYGFLDKIQGDIIIDNENIDKLTDKDLAKRISVVLTEKVSVYNMSVRELVAMGRSPYNDFWGTVSEEDEKMIDNCIKMVNIKKLENRYIENLSDGERQKVMIAKALVQDTPIILLDEPTAFLDFPSKVEIVQLLHRLSRETNKTIFLSTHDLELALQSADRLWLMDKNSCIHIGTPEDLSLNGVLSKFFQNKGIQFDENTGLFRIKNEANRYIKLMGDGIRFLMMQKALLRIGIKADQQQESNYKIIVDKNKFELYDKEKSIVQSDKIEDILEYLRN